MSVASWISAGLGVVTAHPAWALGLVFAAAIIEALAVVGILMPGTAILMAIAGAAAMAGQSMVPYLAMAILGAVIGDFGSFWIGRRFSFGLRLAWPFSRYPTIMEAAERFFSRFGTASVALCRFVPVLRSTVPLVAGMAGMRTRAFVPANVVSALVWAPLHIYPAQMAGFSLSHLMQGDWVSTLLWAAALAACSAAVWALHRAIRLRWR